MEQDTDQYEYQGYTISVMKDLDTYVYYGTVYKNSIPVFTEQGRDKYYLKINLEQYVKDIKFSFGEY
jgi:hypothetical protein